MVSSTEIGAATFICLLNSWCWDCSAVVISKTSRVHVVRLLDCLRTQSKKDDEENRKRILHLLCFII